MIDPGWAIRTPDQNDLLLKAAPGGLPSMMAALAAYTAEMVSTETAAGVSTSNMVALNAEFQGATSVASTATVTGINTVAHLLFGWLALLIAATPEAKGQYAEGSQQGQSAKPPAVPQGGPSRGVGETVVVPRQRPTRPPEPPPQPKKEEEGETGLRKVA